MIVRKKVQSTQSFQNNTVLETYFKNNEDWLSFISAFDDDRQKMMPLLSLLRKLNVSHLTELLGELKACISKYVSDLDKNSSISKSKSTTSTSTTSKTQITANTLFEDKRNENTNELTIETTNETNTSFQSQRKTQISVWLSKSLPRVEEECRILNDEFIGSIKKLTVDIGAMKDSLGISSNNAFHFPQPKQQKTLNLIFDQLESLLFNQ